MCLDSWKRRFESPGASLPADLVFVGQEDELIHRLQQPGGKGLTGRYRSFQALVNQNVSTQPIPAILLTSPQDLPDKVPLNLYPTLSCDIEAPPALFRSQLELLMWWLINASHNGSQHHAPDRPEHAGLTNCEYKVLELYGQGYHRQQIAERLHRSPYTIDKYRRQLLEKLSLGATHELRAYASALIKNSTNRPPFG